MAKDSHRIFLALAVAAFVLAAAIAGALIADGSESAGPEQGSGEWAENDFFSPGETTVVQVRGTVQQLGGLSSEDLEQAVQTDPPGNRPGDPPILDRLPIDPDNQYLRFRSLA